MIRFDSIVDHFSSVEELVDTAHGHGYVLGQGTPPNKYVRPPWHLSARLGSVRSAVWRSAARSVSAQRGSRRSTMDAGTACTCSGTGSGSGHETNPRRFAGLQSVCRAPKKCP